MAEPPDDQPWNQRFKESAVLATELRYVREDLGRIERKIDGWESKSTQSERDMVARIIQVEQTMAARCVTQDEFKPVMRIVYGAVVLVLVAFVGLVIHTVGWQK